ncbi:hypothetical protein [Bradyrhizobium sp. SYSU BS000235]|uniref:hypothetical protein n=1 Tax=Bradyrhizobium sp. SYSU BS000235 TaxID=3411332 RepID=UPI003C76E26B
MPFVEISRDQFAKIADQVEDRAYTLPAGPERTDVLLQAYSMQTLVNRAQWDDEIVFRTETFARPDKLKPS